MNLNCYCWTNEKSTGLQRKKTVKQGNTSPQYFRYDSLTYRKGKENDYDQYSIYRPWRGSLNTTTI